MYKLYKNRLICQTILCIVVLIILLVACIICIIKYMFNIMYTLKKLNCIYVY